MNMELLDYKLELSDLFFKLMNTNGLMEELKSRYPDIDPYSAAMGYLHALGKLEEFVTTK